MAKTSAISDEKGSMVAAKKAETKSVSSGTEIYFHKHFL